MRISVEGCCRSSCSAWWLWSWVCACSSHTGRTIVLLTWAWHRTVLLLQHHLLLTIKIRVIRSESIHASPRMKNCSVAVHEIHRHLMILHGCCLASWLPHFKVVELLRSENARCIGVGLCDSASILLRHSLLKLLLLLLLKWLVHRRLVQQCRCLRLACWVLLRALRAVT